mgnify:FL=1
MDDDNEDDDDEDDKDGEADDGEDDDGEDDQSDQADESTLRNVDFQINTPVQCRYALF